MKSCIHFIRHGITEGIVNKWYYGNVDLPLIDEGIKELNEFKAQGIYPDVKNASCYTSGMLRANQTFEVIYGNSNYEVIDNLKEISFGDWECKTFEEIKALEGFELWVNDKSGTFTFPGGDSPLGFYERVSKGLDKLLENHFKLESTCKSNPSGGDATSIAVCHGGVISVCMCQLLKEPKDTFWQWTPKPGRGYSVYLENGKAVDYKPL